MRELVCSLLKVDFVFLSIIAVCENEYIMATYFILLAIFTQLIDMGGKEK